MANHPPSLRFDHREIAVIFSLFIFVSLLMFTVGILVGKGLAQAKYENPSSITDLAAINKTAPAPHSEEKDMPLPKAAPITEAKSSTESVSIPAEGKAITFDEADEAEDEKEIADSKNAPLELVPAAPIDPSLSGFSLQEPAKGKDKDVLLKNPRIRALVEDDGTVKRTTPAPAKARSTASKAAALAKPRSTAQEESSVPVSSVAAGKYTVQVGSYATEKDAADRVEALKKLGFPHAYFSAKQLVDKKETWYRVWLGYFPDLESAQQSGRLLQNRGEVKNYIVRKTDTTG